MLQCSQDFRHHFHLTAVVVLEGKLNNEAMLDVEDDEVVQWWMEALDMRFMPTHGDRTGAGELIANYTRLLLEAQRAGGGSGCKDGSEGTESRGEDAGEAGAGTDDAVPSGEVAPALPPTSQSAKLVGTIHCALGNSYPNAGGKNKSAIHWDIVTDMRQGRITVDGKLLYENGVFVN